MLWNDYIGLNNKKDTIFQDSIITLADYNICGIYVIMNCKNGKCYIGSSNCIKNRIRAHIRELNKNTHHCNHLQRAWNKYGKDVFVSTIWEECEQKDLIKREKYWIDTFNVFNDKLYNSQINPHEVFNWTGRHHTEKTKLKMSESALKAGRVRKLNLTQVKDIKDMLANGFTLSTIADKYNVATSTIFKIKHNKKWKYA